MEFSAPTSTSTGIRPADLENHLLVVEPSEFVAGLTTSMGTSDAVRATIHDITTQTTHDDALLFSKVLVGSLKGRIGQRVLAILGKGTAKPGQSAPWVLTDMSGDAEAIKNATEYLTSRTASSLTTPAPAQAAVGVELTPELLAALGNLTGKG